MFFSKPVSVRACIFRISVAVACVVSAVAGLVSGAPSRPNIIYILADDLGIGDLGAYGQKRIATPHLDGLATEGIRFANHYSGSAVCAPSRACLMTGLHTGHAPIRKNDASTLLANSLTVAKILKQAGYATGCVGKWGMGAPGDAGVALKQGFDFFYGYYDQTAAHDHYPDTLYRDAAPEKLDGKTYSTDRFSAEALGFLDRSRAGPFFLYLAYTLPHANLQVPSQGAYAAQSWPPNEKTFAAMVSYLDSSVGLVLAKLKAMGADSNTLVLFASDNGAHAEGGQDAAFFDSDGPYRGIKRDPYDGGIHVPFMARWRGTIAPGTTSDWIGSFPDFLPTVCDLIGYHAPPGIDGISFAPILTGQAARQVEHAYLYWEFNGDGYDWVAARMGRWKGVWRKGTGVYELYDLSKDPGETTDLAAANPKVLDSLKVIFTQAHTAGSPVIGMPGPVAAGPGSGTVSRRLPVGRVRLAVRRDGRGVPAGLARERGGEDAVDALGQDRR